MADLTIWHNPRCSKSRQALALLQERGLDPEIVEYLKQPPSAAQLAHALELLGLGPRELMRSSESAFAEGKLGDPALTREQLIRAMVEHPILIERPVVLTKDRAVIGRPPERVLELL
jgi:arsenate reductase (glutaredoxin)